MALFDLLKGFALKSKKAAKKGKRLALKNRETLGASAGAAIGVTAHENFDDEEMDILRDPRKLRKVIRILEDAGYRVTIRRKRSEI